MMVNRAAEQEAVSPTLARRLERLLHSAAHGMGGASMKSSERSSLWRQLHVVDTAPPCL